MGGDGGEEEEDLFRGEEGGGGGGGWKIRLRSAFPRDTVSSGQYVYIHYLSCSSSGSFTIFRQFLLFCLPVLFIYSHFTLFIEITSMVEVELRGVGVDGLD